MQIQEDDGVDIPLQDGSELRMRIECPEGARTWVVFLHGFGSTQNGEKVQGFRSWAREAGLGFVSFDFRGHGASGGSMRELSLSRNLEDLRAVLDALVIAHPRSFNRTVLLGSSMGAATAMWLCARQPRRIAASILIAPALYTGRAFEEWAGPEGLDKWRRDGSIMFEGGFTSAELDWNFISDIRTYEVDELLATYKTPSLILQGLQDETVLARDVVDFVQRSSAEIDCVLYGQGDHRLTREKFRLWTAILDFLSARSLL